MSFESLKPRFLTRKTQIFETQNHEFWKFETFVTQIFNLKTPDLTGNSNSMICNLKLKNPDSKFGELWISYPDFGILSNNLDFLDFKP